MENMNLPKIHSREREVEKAEMDLRSRLLEWMKEHDLTTYEHLRVVNQVLSGEIAGTLKYAIREERHGNTDTPGGLES